MKHFFVLVVFSFLNLSAQADATDCEDLFAGSNDLLHIGLAPEKIREVWARGDKEKRYLEAGAKVSALLRSAPRHFYRALSLLSPFANLKRQAALNLNPIVRAAPLSEIQNRWHRTGLDITAELMRKTRNPLYGDFPENPSPEFKDLLSYTIRHMKPLNPALLTGRPDPLQSQMALEIMMRQQGVDFERVQGLLDHSRTFRNLFVIDGGEIIFRKVYNREPTTREFYFLNRLLDHLLDNRVAAPPMTPEYQPLADSFSRTFKLDRQNRFPSVSFEAVMSAMIHLKEKFIEEQGLPVHKGQRLILEPHALSWSLLKFLEDDQIGGSDQLFFQFSCLFTQIIPASWPARTEIEADMLKHLVEQMHSL